MGVLARRGVPAEAPLYLMGCAVATVALAQPVVDPAPALAQVVRVGVPAAVGLGAALYGGVAVRRSDRPRDRLRHVLLTCGLSAGVAEGAVGVVAVVYRVQGTTMGDPLFVQAVVLAVAVGVGVPGGLYYDELVRTRQALREEVDRTAALNQQLQVVNRVLRHNVRTELTVLAGHMERVVDAGDVPAESVAECREALGRLEELVEKVGHIQQLGPAAGDERQDAAAVATRAVVAARDRAPESGELQADVPAAAPVHAHPLLETAVTELVENAIQHAGGVVAIRVDADPPAEAVARVDADAAVTVAVCDDGDGVPAHELAALSRDREAPLEHGSGVGLWLVRWVADASGADLGFEERPGGGTVVRLTLRAASE